MWVTPLLSALWLTTQPASSAIVLDECPANRPDCVMAALDWAEGHDLPPEDEALTEREHGHVVRRGFRTVMQARVGDEGTTEIDLGFATHVDGMSCNQFDGTGGWPLVGWSADEHPIVLTDHGPLTLEDDRVLIGRYAFPDLLLDAATLRPVRQIQRLSYGMRIWIRDRDTVVMAEGFGSDRRCIYLPDRREGALRAADPSLCALDSSQPMFELLDADETAAIDAALRAADLEQAGAVPWPMSSDGSTSFSAFRVIGDASVLYVTSTVPCT